MFYNKYIVPAIIGLLFSCLLASCGGGGGGGGGGNPVANDGNAGSQSVAVSTNNPARGSTFTVTISVQSVTDLQIANYELNYNHSVIEIINTVTLTDSVEDGTVFSVPTIEFEDSIPGNNLLISYHGNGSTFTGSGTICVITFSALAAGSTSISFVSPGTHYGFGDDSSSYPIILSEDIIVSP